MTIATATLAQWFELVGHVGIAHTSLRASFEGRLKAPAARRTLSGSNIGSAMLTRSSE